MLTTLKPVDGSLRLNKPLNVFQCKYLSIFSSRQPCVLDIKEGDDLSFEFHIKGMNGVSLREICGLPLDNFGTYVIGNLVHSIVGVQNPVLPKGVCGWHVDIVNRSFLVFSNKFMVMDSDTFGWLCFTLDLMKKYWGVLVSGNILFVGKHNYNNISIEDSVISREPYILMEVAVGTDVEYFDTEELFEIEDFNPKYLEFCESPTYTQELFLQ